MRSPVQIWVAAPVQTPEVTVIPGALPCLEESFPLFFPLLAANPLDEGLHPGGAGLFHLICDVAVDVQRKGGGGVAQVALHRFDVVPGPDRGHCIRVPREYKQDKSKKTCICKGFDDLSLFFFHQKTVSF